MREKHGAAIEAFNVKDKSGIDGGIVRNRKCTDIIFGFVMMIMMVAMVGLSFYGYTKGHINKYRAPLSHDGSLCGINSPNLGKY